jgi:hypothetical protein
MLVLLILLGCGYAETRQYETFTVTYSSVQPGAGGCSMDVDQGDFHYQLERKPNLLNGTGCLIYHPGDTFQGYLRSGDRTFLFISYRNKKGKDKFEGWEVTFRRAK